MKLRNKKTGEIVEYDEKWERLDGYKPSEYWCINWTGGINHIIVLDETDENEYKKLKREIGNVFDSEKEAEKVVEKLKAWKRLRDKGFKFVGVAVISDMIQFKADEPFEHVAFDPYIGSEEQKEYYNDLMLLFGGEE